MGKENKTSQAQRAGRFELIFINFHSKNHLKTLIDNAYKHQ
jgi:hypothetical protein